MKKYVYIFVRQDISFEQQAVQAAHVTFKLGAFMERYKDLTNWEDPDETYFTLVGVRNEEALSAITSILDKFGFKFESFYEPDLPGVTAVAAYPIDEDKRGPLLAFNLLKMGR